MTIRTFLSVIAFATLICFFVWLAVGVSVNPYLAGWKEIALFYFSLFLWISGIFILIGFYARYLLKPGALPYGLLATSARQALILAIAVSIFLALKSAHVFNWINGLFLAIAAVFAEGYFLSLNHERSRGNRKN
jgi:hypothetical protein